MAKPARELYERLLAEQGPAYKLELSYVGTAFSGFQSQADASAIQDHVEQALKVLLRHPVRIRGASRTDSGVHAQQQVAVFRTKLPFSRRWLLGLNALVPPEIGISSISPVATDFDPIYDAKGKAYRYRLWQGRCFNPFLKPFVWPVSYPLDLALMGEAAQKFVGRHDFAGFCNKDSYARTTVRRVLEVHIDERGPLIDFWISGEGFLKQMVRIIVGTLVDIAAGRLPVAQIDEILQSGRRAHAGLTAPAQGLSLVKIFYDELWSIREVMHTAEKGYCLPLYDDHRLVLSAT